MGGRYGWAWGCIYVSILKVVNMSEAVPAWNGGTQEPTSHQRFEYDYLPHCFSSRPRFREVISCPCVIAVKHGTVLVAMIEDGWKSRQVRNGEMRIGSVKSHL